jgi:hypothetical protein
MTPQETNDRIDDVFRDPLLVKSAIELGIADAARRYAQEGQLMASWKNGRVVWVDPVTYQPVECDETQTEAQAAAPAE